MEELIPVYTADKVKHGATLVDARLLHTKLEVDTRFDMWITRRIEEYGFEEGTDFCTKLGESTGGRPATNYHLTLRIKPS